MHLAPPGIDELFGILSVVDARADYDVIVVDMAPTGHALRLLEMPEAAREWTQALLRVLLKYKTLVRPGQLAKELLVLAKSVRELQAMLRDAAHTIHRGHPRSGGSAARDRAAAASASALAVVDAGSRGERVDARSGYLRPLSRGRRVGAAIAGRTATNAAPVTPAFGRVRYHPDPALGTSSERCVGVGALGSAVVDDRSLKCEV